MKAFDAVPEPRAKVWAVIGTVGIGLVVFFLIDPRVGIGTGFGAVVCAVLHWAARVDERPFWRRVLGPRLVPPDNEQGLGGEAPFRGPATRQAPPETGGAFTEGKGLFGIRERGR